MNEQEEKDLAELREKIKTEKIHCYDYLLHIQRMSAIQLEHSGYRGKTNAEAMQLAYNSSQIKLEKLSRDFLKKYPDK